MKFFEHAKQGALGYLLVTGGTTYVGGLAGVHLLLQSREGVFLKAV